MFAWWGTAVSKFRWVILVLAIAFLALAGLWGISVFGKLSGSSSLDDPHSESQRINQRVLSELGSQSVDLIGLYSSPTLTVNQPQFRDSVEAVATKIRAYPYVAAVNTYYESHSAAFVSTNRHETYLTVRLTSNASDDQANHVRHNLRAAGLTSQAGGQRAVDLDINSEVPSDIEHAEMIATPILLVALLIVFSSLVAACMPLLIGMFAVMGAFLLERVITIFTTVSIFSLNIVTVLGLGLAIDYGLFVVGRFREELDRGRSVRGALSRTMATAGRTVAISGVLLALALSSLTLFPQILLRSMGFGGAAAVLCAMLASLTVLPAVLALLGHRINAVPMPWRRRRQRRRVASVTGAIAGAGADTSGAFARIAASVMRRPVAYLIGCVAVLAVLALPFFNVHFGGIDERMLPANTQSRVVAERLDADFPGANMRPIQVLVSNASPAAVSGFQHEIDALPDASGSSIAAQTNTASLVSVNYAGDASSLPARHLVTAIRNLAPPAGANVMVGGTSASIVDQLNSLGSRLPWMLLLVALITFLVLAIGFGSLVVPIKAILMNLLSIGAAFGVVTWIFQGGHLSGWLNFTPTGYVEASQPILMIAVLFGLSLDYEVFLLSRIRERWDELGDNRVAVASGVQRTGRIITTAALLLCVVIGFFTTSGITFIKMIGVGMVVALIVDATVVRLLLVPATMRLLGRYNWWAPRFLQRMYGRFGLSDSADPAAADSADPAAAAGSADPAASELSQPSASASDRSLALSGGLPNHPAP